MKQVKLASNFLQNAPPGEYEQCSAALGTIVSDSNTVRQARQQSGKIWHENSYYYVIVSDHQAIVCKEACQPDGSYLDPTTGKTFKFDYESKKTSLTGQSVNLPQICTDIMTILTPYCEASYKEKSACGCYPCPDGSVYIVMRSSSISLPNYRTGAVYASYKLSKDGTLKGRIDAIQHFFESGNALGQFGANLASKVKMGSNTKEVAKEVIRVIDEFEQKWLDAANTAFERVNNEALFKLRRKIPFTHSKIDWERELTPGSFIA
ncbi:F-actin-capping protein subunit alpha [Tritrichomonas foetus]|uniref:F-actin-capping protein subunit alpha n=1 Tax=Tritrichomonas foetus TaxID=1144522 RepID=A0A1J4KMD1_9EUKA|nr:F-actin-capping protein subunit alpha [Tritrichomonas foetus]|eukprot:OHT10525.1 F-actin-capping protein subunit alpha [Tritrichomonas foetus]